MTQCHNGRVVRKTGLREAPPFPMKTLTLSYDVVVCGGGLAGFCAAVAAARHGAKVALVQDRPVLGGNASSEIRVTVHGAAQFHNYARETGILSELLIEERARNHEEINENGWTNSLFDQVLYDLAQRTPGLTLHLNTAVHDVLLGDDDFSGLADIPNRPLPDTANGWYRRPACAPRTRIAAVVARVANAETELTLRARTFIDATGDGLVADLAGCGWRMGSESKEQTGEVHAPAAASTNTMGNSIHIRARDIGRPAPFTPPAWSKTIPHADFFHKKGRHLSDLRGGYWWIEIGMPWHTIHDNETIRHELTAWALAIWDWIKNHDATTKDRATNYALEWIGQVPGKRESRRIDGLYQFNEHDIQANVKHADEIAFGRLVRRSAHTRRSARRTQRTRLRRRLPTGQ
jgi:FAD dependent oxidoreductase